MTHPSEIKVNEVLDECREHLSDEEWREAFAYSEVHGEYGLALETLADILVEKDVALSLNQLSSIKGAFQFMALDPGRRVEHLERLRARAQE